MANFLKLAENFTAIKLKYMSYSEEAINKGDKLTSYHLSTLIKPRGKKAKKKSLGVSKKCFTKLEWNLE